MERRRAPASRTSRSTASCRAPTRARSTTSPRSSTARSTRRRTFATQSEDDNVLVTGVAGDVNAIGSSATPTSSRTRTSSRRSRSTAAAAASRRPRRRSTTTATPRCSRPLFIYPDVGKAKERPELKAFVDFYLDEHRRPSRPRSATSRCRPTCSDGEATSGRPPSAADRQRDPPPRGRTGSSSDRPVRRISSPRPCR